MSGDSSSESDDDLTDNAEKLIWNYFFLSMKLDVLDSFYFLGVLNFLASLGTLMLILDLTYSFYDPVLLEITEDLCDEPSCLILKLDKSCCRKLLCIEAFYV